MMGDRGDIWSVAGCDGPGDMRKHSALWGGNYDEHPTDTGPGVQQRKQCLGSGKETTELSEVLNEAVVVIFFSLGPALGATIFLMWFGGIVWGLLSSFLR